MWSWYNIVCGLGCLVGFLIGWDCGCRFGLWVLWSAFGGCGLRCGVGSNVVVFARWVVLVLLLLFARVGIFGWLLVWLISWCLFGEVAWGF